MEIKLVAYGIAKDILGSNELSLSLDKGNTVIDLKNELTKMFPEFEKLSSLRFAVNEEYKPDSFELQGNDQVIIIPPVSGG